MINVYVIKNNTNGRIVEVTTKPFSQIVEEYVDEETTYVATKLGAEFIRPHETFSATYHMITE